VVKIIYFYYFIINIDVNNQDNENINSNNAFITEPPIEKNNYLKNNQKSQITIAIRIRPLSQNEKELSDIESVTAINSNSLSVSSENSAKKNSQIKYQQFFFDYVFDKTATQQEIYTKTTKNLLESIIEGYNATVFAYGATGSGKTYTMLGINENERGIMPRSVIDLFKMLNKRKNKEFRLSVSYVEIYNEEIRDLLGNREELKLHEDPTKGVIIQGVKEIFVDNVDNFFDILYKGNQKRTVGKTNANETSSRSHALLKINIENKDKEGPNSSNINCGRFILVDLAGSEKNNSSINPNNNNNSNNNLNAKNNLRQQEGAKINQSLLYLGICINALASKSKFIPWRNSKLTHILKDSIGGNAKIVMISTISPSLFCTEETLNTLNYSNRAKNITTIIKKNVINVIDRESQVNKYKEIINNLSDELEAKRNQLAVITNNKYLLPKKDINGINNNGSLDGQNLKMDKISKEIKSHFNEEMRIKLEIFETKKNINNLINNLKDKEFSLYKLLNKSPNVKKSFNNISNNTLNINLKEKEIRSTMKKISDQVQNQKSILMNKESKYNELVKKRTHLENAINKFGNIGTTNNNANNNINDSTNNFSALQYLYHSYILEINNLENEFIRKQNTNEILEKNMKINKLLEQLKIRDEYIKQEKKSLNNKKIKFIFEREKDIKKIDDLIGESQPSLPVIYQQDKRLNTQTMSSNSNININPISTSNRSRNKVYLMNNGQYDYSGYSNPNIIMEKKVIRTKTNEIITKTKKNQLSELKLNMLNDQYKNSKVVYLSKGQESNRSFGENNNIIIFDTKKLNKSQSFSTISARSKSKSRKSKDDSFNNSFGNSRGILNYREREIDNKIRRVMIGKKKASPYLK
jgi:kinesin family protein 18/19